jgi:hypothetical protein
MQYREFIEAAGSGVLLAGYVRGSLKDFPMGTILKPWSGYLERWGQNLVYAILEEHRPSQCLLHEQSAFMVQSDHMEDVLTCSGSRSGFLFTVEPAGRVERI